MNNINALLPHRSPFQFVDNIIYANPDEIVGVKTYDPYFSRGHFPQHQLVPGVLLIEAMAQCGGAGLNTLGVAGTALWGLAAIENARFLGIVEPGNTVKMIIKNLKITNRIIKQSGIAYCNGKIVVKAEWICARINLS